MEEDIDLRPYIRALGRHWWWVVGLALAAAVIGFVISSLLPAVYEASSVALVTQPRYQLQFDPRFITQQDLTAQKSVPTLAASEELLQTLIDAYRPPPEAHIKAWNLAGLATMVTASPGRDPSLLMLRVHTGSAQVSADIANRWLDLLVKKGSTVYDGGQDLASLEGQTTQAKQTLDKASAAIVEFQSRNQARVLEAQLSAQEHAQADLVSSQISMTTMIRDVQGLRDQFAKQPLSQPVSAADSLTLFLLQIKAFDAGASLPQLQFSSSESLINLSRQDQLALMENLIAALQKRPAEVEAQRAALEPKMLAMQRELQDAQTQLGNLQSRQNLAQGTYETLARKLDEARIAGQTGSGTVQVASYASVPQAPISPRPLRNSAVAGVGGLMLGVFAILASEWWKR